MKRPGVIRAACIASAALVLTAHPAPVAANSPRRGAVRVNTIRAQYGQVRTALLEIRDSAPGERNHGDESPRVLRLYNRAWNLIARWAVAYFVAHPGASARQLIAAINALDDNKARECVAAPDEEYGDPFAGRDCFAVRADALRFGERTHPSVARATAAALADVQRDPKDKELLRFRWRTRTEQDRAR